MSKSELVVYQGLRFQALIGAVLCPIVGIGMTGWGVVRIVTGTGADGGATGGLLFFGLTFLLGTLVCIHRLRTLNSNRPTGD